MFLSYFKKVCDYYLFCFIKQQKVVFLTIIFVVIDLILFMNLYKYKYKRNNKYNYNNTQIRDLQAFKSKDMSFLFFISHRL